MRLNVGARDMQTSSRNHANAASAIEPSGSAASSALLLIYAAECGLKAAVMRRSSIRDTASLPEHIGTTHSLRTLAKELRLPASIQVSSLRCAAKRAGAPHVEDDQLHQAWRYGRDLKAEDEARAIGVLHEVLEWCKNEANGAQ